MRWRDPIPNWNVALTEAFKDAAAVELYHGPQEPFIGMGSMKTPIDVWFWDADRQKMTSPPEGEYPNTVVDMYPFAETRRTGHGGVQPQGNCHKRPAAGVATGKGGW